MNATQQTVVGVDGSAASLDAVRWAAIDAALHHRDVLLIASIGSPIDPGSTMILPTDYYDVLYSDAARSLAEARVVAEASAGADSGVSIQTEATEQAPVLALLDKARTARLLVLGSRGLGALGRGLLGSVSSAVAMHAECSVTVVRTYSEMSARSTATKSIVVGTDGSSHGEVALREAFEEASIRHAPVTAVHAWTDGDLAVGMPGRGPGWDDGRAVAESILDEQLSVPMTQHPDVPVRRVVVRDRPAAALLDHALAGQMLVVGSHGRGGFRGMLLGSTSRSVIHGAACPVMVVRSPVSAATPAGVSATTTGVS